jgi:UDP-N-acetylmuramoyl-tripeptide--D-alanyl-D-alanine ligase
MKMTKSEILAVPHREAFGFDGLKDFKITGVSIDSRTVAKGDLFIALRGERFDGHNFISKAVEAGAACILVEHRWSRANAPMMVSIHIPRIVVDNTVESLGHLAAAYRRKFNIPFIAVGGSNGKTTTKEMMKSVLSARYRVLGTEGNLNNHIGVPQTLLRLENKHEVAVLEIGTNHPGEINYLCSMARPTHGLITNIGREHLEFFESLEGVAKAEGELFDWLSEHRGIAFVNNDDRYIKRLKKKVKKKVCFGFAAGRDLIKGTVVSTNAHGRALLRVKPAGKKSFEVEVGVPGEHNAKNALAAAAVGLALKVGPPDIQKALNSFQAATNRSQIRNVAGVTILNDTYNANPDSMIAALDTLKRMDSPGKKIAVLGDMLELGDQSAELHRQIGETIANYRVDIVLTFGERAKSLHDAVSADTKAHFDDKNALAEYLARSLADGDIVLIKGSRGMKMEEVVSALSERLQQNAKE